MSRLTELISQAKAKDRQLGEDLEREFRALSSRRAFGLNFERHRPEVVELCQRPVRKGDKVRILPERGSTKSGDQRLWLVRNIGEGESPSAEIEPLVSEERETRQAQVDDLVVIAEFRDFIYPGLVSTGKVERGGDKPFHTVINGENFHALEALASTSGPQLRDFPTQTCGKAWCGDASWKRRSANRCATYSMPASTNGRQSPLSEGTFVPARAEN